MVLLSTGMKLVICFTFVQELFDFIASSLYQFVEKKDSVQSPITKLLGFTFSFPVKQTSVSSGVLIKWTKGFAIRDMVSVSYFFLRINAFTKLCSKLC